MSRTLFLTSTATASPFPTTSRIASETANASEVTLGPGEFDQGLPGAADAGQWNPSSPIANTTAAAEIDNTGASPGTTRQGWLWNVDHTGKTLLAGTYTIQLRLAALQGTGTLARMFLRVTVVTGSGGLYTTVANLLTTAVTGGAPSAGQTGWRAQQDASRITVVTAAANFTGAIALTATSTAHTFASGQRLLFELGFGDADSATDRTWRLDFNTSNSFITIPDLLFDESLGTDSIAVTDSITAELIAGVIQRTASDSISVTDAIAAMMAFERSMSDTIDVTQTLVVERDLGAAGSDTITVVDDSATSADYLRNLSDSVDVADSIIAQILGVIEVIISDSINVTDAITRSADFGRSATDTVDVTQTLVVERDLGAAGSDTITVVDDSATSADFLRNLSDAIEITDSIIAQIIAAETIISDSVSVTDQLLASVDFSRLMSDTIDVTQTLVANLDLGLAGSDTITVVDDSQTSADYLRNLSDDIDVTQTLVVERDLGAAGSDTITVVDDSETSADFLRNLSDLAAVVDSITAQIVGTIEIVISDTIGVTDSIEVQKIGVQTADASDIVGMTDSIEVELIRPVVPPTPPAPPKPKPKKKKSGSHGSHQTYTSSGSSQTLGHGLPLDFFFTDDLLERLIKTPTTDPPAPLAVVVPPEPYQPWPPPQAEQPRLLSYIDRVDSSHHFTENKQDQSDRRVATYNFGQEDNTLRTVLLIALGVGLAALIWSAARGSEPLASPAPAGYPRRARRLRPRSRAAARARGR